MQEEKIKILKMLEDGKISSDEAGRLLEALNRPVVMERRSAEDVAAQNGKKKWLRIQVYDKVRGKSKVNIRVPWGLFRMVSHLIPESAKLQLNEKNIDLNQLLQQVETVEGGKLIEVDEEDGERVEISLE